MASSETILSNQTHPGDSVVETVTGEKFKGDGYYGRSDGFHTVQYSIDGFIGIISIQASLAVMPEETDWFTLSESIHNSTITGSDSNDGNYIKNFTGNYIWLRATITDWTDGVVSKILLNH